MAPRGSVALCESAGPESFSQDRQIRSGLRHDGEPGRDRLKLVPFGPHTHRRSSRSSGCKSR